MRPIDADVVIEKVMNYCKDDDGSCVEANADIRELLDEIENLPTIQPEPQWIPCSERMPEEPGYYITSNEYNGVTEDFYCDDYFWNADRNAYEVIAWMPLPEAYKPNK